MINLLKKLFKPKTLKEKLEEKLAKTQKEAFELSKTNRRASDAKHFEANKILEQIKVLSKTEGE